MALLGKDVGIRGSMRATPGFEAFSRLLVTFPSSSQTLSVPGSESTRGSRVAFPGRIFETLRGQRVRMEQQEEAVVDELRVLDVEGDELFHAVPLGAIESVRTLDWPSLREPRSAGRPVPAAPPPARRKSPRDPLRGSAREAGSPGCLRPPPF